MLISLVRWLLLLSFFRLSSFGLSVLPDDGAVIAQNSIGQEWAGMCAARNQFPAPPAMPPNHNPVKGFSSRSSPFIIMQLEEGDQHA